MGRVVSERGPAWPESHRRRELYHTHRGGGNTVPAVPICPCCTCGIILTYGSGWTSIQTSAHRILHISQHRPIGPNIGPSRAQHRPNIMAADGTAAAPCPVHAYQLGFGTAAPAPNMVKMVQAPAPRTYAMSCITMYKHVSAAYADAHNNLDVGHLLKWMDIAACLSAERHAKADAVTLSMDDVNFECAVPVGAIVRVVAKVNKIFGTSMEVGVSVNVEPQRPGQRRQLVCAPCFTFVALDANGKKVKTAPAVAASAEERFAASLAQERRQWRLKRKQLELEASRAAKEVEEEKAGSALLPRVRSVSRDADAPHHAVPEVAVINDLVALRRAHKAHEDDAAATRPPPPSRTLPLVHALLVHARRLLACGGVDSSVSSVARGGARDAMPSPYTPTSVEMTQLALPHCANHHGNVFGGQMMAWMAEAATVAAARHAPHVVPAPAATGDGAAGRHQRQHRGGVYPVIAIIDALQFLAASKVGDRILLNACVTRTFGTSLEVLVRVRAHAVGSDALRDINT